MSDIAIRAEGISKQFFISSAKEHYQAMRDILISSVTAPIRRAGNLIRGKSAEKPKTIGFWALQDISFEVKRGEVIGVIGRNGAGKSTLLKILSQITEPTTGSLDIYGRVGSLLEVGTGFHKELTGRENIYLNGAILGMKRTEIDRKFDEIVAFAEVEKFIDTPVKRYSSGMGLRLGFAVAAHLEPEILVVDEVLAVGDTAFQKKCLGKMENVAKEGRTVLFVSHNMAAVSALCTKGFLLSNGALVNEGPVNDVIKKYIELATDATSVSLVNRKDRQGSGRIRFTNLTCLDENGSPMPAVVAGRPATILLDYTTADGQSARNINASIEFHGSFGELLFVCEARLARGNFTELPPRGQVACHIPKLPLNPGQYNMSISFVLGTSNLKTPGVVLDRIDDAGKLLVEAGDFYPTGNLPLEMHRATVMVDHEWHLVGENVLTADYK
jgi:lipopolysaccharide transport system ATP-binding protein